jgi:hypothetical protein
MRGIVRNFSQVHLEYPGLYPPLRPPSPVKRTPWPKPKFKKVILSDIETKPSCRDLQDVARNAADRSDKMRVALFNLRRAGKPQSPSPEPDQEDKKITSTRTISPPRKKGRKLLAAVQATPPPEIVEFTYTWQEHNTLPLKEKVEQELKQIYCPVEEIEQRFAATDSLGIELTLDALKVLFENRFPVVVKLRIGMTSASVQEKEQGEEDQEQASADAETFSPEEQEEIDKAMKQLHEKETTVMIGTLNGTRDSSDEVEPVLIGLEELQHPVAENGGSRHATAVVAFRTLMIVRRKLELLTIVEERKGIFEKEAERKVELFKDVTAGNSPPEGLLYIRQFVGKYAHKPEANPADADKSNFEHFAATFGMPRKHMYFEAMMDLAKATVTWWAQETLKLAYEGGESDQIKRHMDVVQNIGAAKQVYEELDQLLKECLEIMGDKLAERCLKVAQSLQEKDEATQARSKDAQHKSAKDSAQAVNDEIRRAVSLGAPNKHPMLIKAKEIATALEQTEKARYGLKALLAAEKIRKRDEEEALVYEKGQGFPPVGPASDYADKIDKEIKECIKLGALPNNESILKAIAMGKEMRDLDGIRKRTANRAKRLAADASK